MPILSVHGVAIRTGEQPEWQTLQRMIQGALWPEVQVALRQHAAEGAGSAPDIQNTQRKQPFQSKWLSGLCPLGNNK